MNLFAKIRDNLASSHKSVSSDIDDTILFKIWAVINELNVWRFPSRVSFNNLKKLLLDSIVKPLNRAHLQVLKNLSVIERCPLLGVGLTKIVAFGTKHFVRYSRHVRYWEVSLYIEFDQNFV